MSIKYLFIKLSVRCLKLSLLKIQLIVEDSYFLLPRIWNASLWRKIPWYTWSILIRNTPPLPRMSETPMDIFKMKKKNNQDMPTCYYGLICLTFYYVHILNIFCEIYFCCRTFLELTVWTKRHLLLLRNSMIWINWIVK